MSKDDTAKKLVSLGSAITGNLATTVTGYLVAGPPGALAGSAVGPIVTTLGELSGDFLARNLSNREIEKVALGFTYSVNRIWERLLAGEIPQQSFFATSANGKSPAHEILEGVLTKCKNEHEEKKARYIGNIFGNAAFLEASPALVNQVLRVGEIMTYRQMCVVSLIERRNDLGFDSRAWSTSNLRNLKASQSSISVELANFLREVYELGPNRLGLLSYQGDGIIYDASEHGDLTATGKICFELMDLSDVPEMELRAIISNFGRIEPILYSDPPKPI